MFKEFYQVHIDKNNYRYYLKAPMSIELGEFLPILSEEFLQDHFLLTNLK